MATAAVTYDNSCIWAKFRGFVLPKETPPLTAVQPPYHWVVLMGTARAEPPALEDSPASVLGSVCLLEMASRGRTQGNMFCFFFKSGSRREQSRDNAPRDVLPRCVAVLLLWPFLNIARAVVVPDR